MSRNQIWQTYLSYQILFKLQLLIIIMIWSFSSISTRWCYHPSKQLFLWKHCIHFIANKHLPFSRGTSSWKWTAHGSFTWSWHFSTPITLQDTLALQWINPQSKVTSPWKFGTASQARTTRVRGQIRLVQTKSMSFLWALLLGRTFFPLLFGCTTLGSII